MNEVVPHFDPAVLHAQNLKASEELKSFKHALLQSQSPTFVKKERANTAAGINKEIAIAKNKDRYVKSGYGNREVISMQEAPNFLESAKVSSMQMCKSPKQSNNGS